MNIISPELAKNIKEDLWNGTSQADVAAKIGVTQPSISRIMNGKAYYDIPWPDGTVGAMPREQRVALHRTRYTGVRATAVAAQLARLSPVTPKAIAKVIHDAAMAAEDNDDTELLGSIAEVGPPASDAPPDLSGKDESPPPMVSLAKAKKALGNTKFAKACGRDTKLMDCVRQVLATLPAAQATPEQVERLARNMRR